jgi:hypothetical protein
MMSKSTLLKTLGLLALVSVVAWGAARSGWLKQAPASTPTPHCATNTTKWGLDILEQRFRSIQFNKLAMSIMNDFQ